MFKLSNFLFIFPILLISLFTLYPSFNLALFGDDWLAIHRYVTDVGSLSAGFSRHLQEYLLTYGPTQVIMGILVHFYNFNSTLFYITSYILRLFAAFSLFPIVFYLTKNKLSAFFAVLFFSVTATGFDTTNWVFNMTSYLAIGFFSLFLYFYLRSKEKGRMIFLLPAIILLYLAYITCSIRMHATLPLIILLEVFWNLQERNFFFARKSLIRFGLIIATIFFIRFTGNSFGNPSEGTSRLIEGLNVITSALNHGRYDLLAYPFTSFGSVFFPDIVLPFSGQVSSTRNLIIDIVLPILTVFIVLYKLFALLTHNLKKTFFGILVAVMIVWTVVTIVFYRLNISTFSSVAYISLMLMGGYIIIIGLMFIAENYKNKSTSTLLILSLALTLLSYLYAWWWRPELYSTTNRYLIVAAAGAAMFLSGLISLGKNKHYQIAIFIIFIPLLGMHIHATRIYEHQLITFGHGQETVNKIWSSMPDLSEISKKERVSVFYIIGDGTNGSILHDSITFGFGFHTALIYNITQADKVPIVIDSWEEAVSVVTDGKAFIRQYGEIKKPIPVENVYAFKLEGTNHLIDITLQVREELRKELQKI